MREFNLKKEIEKTQKEIKDCRILIKANKSKLFALRTYKIRETFKAVLFYITPSDRAIRSIGTDFNYNKKGG